MPRNARAIGRIPSSFTPPWRNGDHLHGREEIAANRVDVGEHALDREVDVVHRAEGLVVERVQADRDALEPGVLERLRLARQQGAVRRQRQVDTRDRGEHLQQGLEDRGAAAVPRP